MSIPIDWDALRAAASEASTHAYAPYSGLHVGAAMLFEDGTIISSCNVENASYGLGACAEVTLVGRIHMLGLFGHKVLAVACTDQFDRHLTPCGRCRQVLMEHAGPAALIDGENGPRPLGELLPDFFGPGDLAEVGLTAPGAA